MVTITDTEKLRDDVLAIGEALLAGKMSNAVARTLLQRSKIALDTLRAEMEAAKMGCDFRAVALHHADRKTIKRVA